MNAAAESFTGWTEGQAIGELLHTVVNMIDPQTRATIEMPGVDRCIEGAIGLENHTIIVSKDGIERAIEPTASLNRNSDGQMAGMVVLFRDVTAREQGEHALHDACNYANNIIANLREPFLVLDGQLRVQAANAAFCDTFMVEAESVKDVFLYTLGNGAWNISQLLASLRDVLLHGSTLRNFETEHSFPFIGKRIMMLNASRFAPGHPPPEYILLAIEDVTVRKQTDRNVKASESRYRRLFETARDGILILDADSLKIIDANPFMTELLGYARDEFLGRELWEFGFFTDKKASQAVYQELKAKGCIRYDHLPLKGKGGESAEVEFISNVYDVEGRKVAQCNIRDISERSRLERQLQVQTDALADLHRRKDEFLAMLSHELRNPLGPIVNAVHILQLKKDTDTIQQRAHAIIKRQVSQLTHLVDDLMEVSRITSGRVRLRCERIDVRTAVEHGIDTIRSSIESSRHHLRVSIPVKSVWIDADPSRIEQIIVNLLSNAAKYTDTGGDIEVTLKEEGQECVLRVKDNGIGIAPDLLPNIFDLFTQADRSLDRARGGLGIGLAIVKRLADMHCGRVEVTSLVGQGTEFCVRLPLISSPDAKEEGLSQRISPLSAPLHASGLRVLITDDNVDEVMSLEMLMKSLGHEVRTAYESVATLALAEQFQPHVVLLDIGLPGMDGYQIAKRLRQSPHNKDLVLVAITGYGQESDRQRSKSAGFNHHLVKPASIEQLEHILSAIAVEQPEIAIAPPLVPAAV